MTRKIRPHLSDEATTGLDTQGSAYAPREMRKQAFGRKLYKLMIARGWSQSDLHRASGLARDSISTYVRGLVTPTPQNLQKLAEALGVDAAELYPDYDKIAVAEEDEPEMEFKVSPGAPDRAYLRINRLVSLEAAQRVIEIIAEDTRRMRERKNGLDPEEHKVAAHGG